MNSLLLCIPFAGLLLCIAVMPLVKPEWWEKHQALAVIVWSLLFIIPSIVLNGAGETTETVLECIVNDYLTFIVLLFGLFCVSGNITLEGNLAGSPAVNALFLAFGTLLSSCIGTTGASMLLVRPMIKMNSWRKNKAQIMIFFIWLATSSSCHYTKQVYKKYCWLPNPECFPVHQSWSPPGNKQFVLLRTSLLQSHACRVWLQARLHVQDSAY